MGLREQILEDIKTAMKAKEAEKLSAIRMLQSAIKYREIELRPNAITDQDIMGVVKKLAKQRKDSIEEFGKAGRTDLVDKEKIELSILEAYLPAQMSADAVAKIVEEVIKSTGATTMKQMGAVVKEVMAKTGGQADGKMISDLVKSKLST
jgi:uncharacterized protein YqeY